MYYFRNGGREEIFLGSADLMLRNLSHRIEIVFPVESPSLVQRIRQEILEVYLADDVNAYRAQSDGSYHRASRSETAGGVDSQQRSMTRRSGARRHWNDRL
jgi:polyphosphate kinase